MGSILSLALLMQNTTIERDVDKPITCTVQFFSHVPCKPANPSLMGVDVQSLPDIRTKHDEILALAVHSLVHG